MKLNILFLSLVCCFSAANAEEWYEKAPDDYLKERYLEDYKKVPKTLSIQQLQEAYKQVILEEKNDVYDNWYDFWEKYPLATLCKDYTYWENPQLLDLWNLDYRFSLKKEGPFSTKKVFEPGFARAADCILNLFTPYDAETYQYFKKFFPQFIKGYDEEKRKVQREKLIQDLFDVGVAALQSKEEKKIMQALYFFSEIRPLNVKSAEIRAAIFKRFEEIANEKQFGIYLSDYVIKNDISSESILTAVIEFESSLPIDETELHTRYDDGDIMKTWYRDSDLMSRLIQKQPSYSAQFTKALNNFIINRFKRIDDIPAEENQIFSYAWYALEEFRPDSNENANLMSYLMKNQGNILNDPLAIQYLNRFIMKTYFLTIKEYEGPGKPVSAYYRQLALPLFISNFATEQPYRYTILKSYFDENKNILCISRNNKGYFNDDFQLSPKFALQLTKLQTTLSDRDLDTAMQAIVSTATLCRRNGQPKFGEFSLTKSATLDLFSPLFDSDEKLTQLVDRWTQGVIKNTDIDFRYSGDEVIKDFYLDFAMNNCKAENAGVVIYKLQGEKSSQLIAEHAKSRYFEYQSQMDDILFTEKVGTAEKLSLAMLTLVNVYVKNKAIDAEFVDQILGHSTEFMKKWNYQKYDDETWPEDLSRLGMVQLSLVSLLKFDGLSSEQILRAHGMSKKVWGEQKVFLYTLELIKKNKTLIPEIQKYFDTLPLGFAVASNSLLIEAPMGPVPEDGLCLFPRNFADANKKYMEKLKFVNDLGYTVKTLFSESK